MPRLRKQVDKAEHDKYFIVRHGITEAIRDDIGLLNSKVGYVYLVDSECRIRWAGSGRADKDERQSMFQGLVRLVRERQVSENEGGRMEQEKKLDRADPASEISRSAVVQ